MKTMQRVQREFMRLLRSVNPRPDPDMSDWKSPCRCGPNDICPCDLFIESYDAHKLLKLQERAEAESHLCCYR